MNHHRAWEICGAVIVTDQFHRRYLVSLLCLFAPPCARGRPASLSLADGPTRPHRSSCVSRYCSGAVIMPALSSLNRHHVRQSPTFLRVSYLVGHWLSSFFEVYLFFPFIFSSFALVNCAGISIE